MAESAAFSLVSNILSTLASPAFDKAYEKGLSIWNARDELKKLQVTVETLQAVLLDAERKQRNSDAIKNWIKRLKGVLYDAEDLFDEVVTNDLLKKQMVEGQNKLSLKKKVLCFCAAATVEKGENVLESREQNGGPLCGQVRVLVVGDSGFFAWKQSIIALSAKNKLCFIDGECDRPARTSPIFKRWERCNSMLISWLLNAMTKSIADTFLISGDARQIW